jgi:hypothetical protein
MPITPRKSPSRLLSGISGLRVAAYSADWLISIPTRLWRGFCCSAPYVIAWRHNLYRAVAFHYIVWRHNVVQCGGIDCIQRPLRIVREFLGFCPGETLYSHSGTEVDS